MSWRRVVLLLAVVLPLAGGSAAACSRCLRAFSDGRVVVGRSMDWMEDPGSEIWVFPRGMRRHGNAGPRSLEWTSRYGSVVVSFYGAASVDGMNEKGLVANVLYLVESDYGGSVAGRPDLSVGGWAQYVLDSFATVEEAVEALRKEPFTIVAPILPNGEPGVGHLSISDTGGDSAIFEYVGGSLTIHHGREHTVMTNSPPFDDQLALEAYWKEIGGDVMLPGTNRASDRFVRARYYVDALPADLPERRAVAAVSSVLRNVSAPQGIVTPGKPNIASTLWRTIHDQKERVLYFDSATSPTVCWIELGGIDFQAGGPVRRLPLADGQTYTGDASAALEPAEPFRFLEASPR